MRIHGAPIEVGGKEAAERPESKPTRETTWTNPAGKVVLSNAAERAVEARARGHVVAAEKINSLRERVQSGDYQPDLRHLAERMADDDLSRRGLQ